MYKKLFVIAIFFIFIYNPVVSQFVNNEDRIKELEEKVTKLESAIFNQAGFNVYMNDLMVINTYRAVLALSIPKNDIDRGYLVMDPEIKTSDGKSQKAYSFFGYRSSFQDYDLDMKTNKNLQITIIRSQMKIIRDVVVDFDYFYYEGKLKNQLKIEFRELSNANSLYIIADINANSLKVRINGEMTEVGWE